MIALLLAALTMPSQHARSIPVYEAVGKIYTINPNSRLSMLKKMRLRGSIVFNAPTAKLDEELSALVKKGQAELKHEVYLAAPRKGSASQSGSDSSGLKYTLQFSPIFVSFEKAKFGWSIELTRGKRTNKIGSLKPATASILPIGTAIAYYSRGPDTQPIDLVYISALPPTR